MLEKKIVKNEKIDQQKNHCKLKLLINTTNVQWLVDA